MAKEIGVAFSSYLFVPVSHPLPVYPPIRGYTGGVVVSGRRLERC